MDALNDFNVHLCLHYIRIPNVVIQRYVNLMGRRILLSIRKMEVILVNDDLLNITLSTQSVIFCFKNLCDCFNSF